MQCSRPWEDEAAGGNPIHGHGSLGSSANPPNPVRAWVKVYFWNPTGRGWVLFKAWLFCLALSLSSWLYYVFVRVSTGMRVNARNHARLVATECDISCLPSQSITETHQVKRRAESPRPRPRPRAIPRCNRRSDEHPGLPLAKCRYRTLPTDYRLPQSGASTCLGVFTSHQGNPIISSSISSSISSQLSQFNSSVPSRCRFPV